MSRTARIALVGLLSVILSAFAAGVLRAETVMIAVRETVDGTPSEPPLPTLEGVSSGLFEAGHIVFDAGKVDLAARTADLAEVAREGKAGWLLQITVTYTQTKLEKEATRVACSATFSLVNTENGSTSLSDEVSTTNAGREKSIDRAALGVELGKLISQKIAKALLPASM
jgi:hypothetical protein